MLSDFFLAPHIVEAFRFTAWTVSLGVVVLMVAWRHEEGTWRRLMARNLTLVDRIWLGVFLTDLHWGFHQLWWWLWQRAMNSGDLETKQALEDASWITVMSYCVMYAGAIFLISPWVRARITNRYILFSSAIVAGLLCTGLVMAA